MHVKIDKGDVFAGLGEDAGQVCRDETLAFLGVEGRHEDHVGIFLGQEVLEVGAQGPEGLGHCTAAVRPARNGVVTHLLVKGNAGNDRRRDGFAQFRGAFNALEKHHARHRQCEGDQKTDRRVGQNGSALVRADHACVARALNQRRFRGDACPGDDGGGFAFEQIHGQFFIHAQLPFHGQNVALGFGQVGQARFELADVRLEVHATALDGAHFVGQVRHHVASEMLRARIDAPHLIRSGLHVQQHGRALRFQFHELSHLFRHPRVVEHEVARRRQLGVAVL